jgi:hypothetical protein
LSSGIYAEQRKRTKNFEKSLHEMNGGRVDRWTGGPPATGFSRSTGQPVHRVKDGMLSTAATCTIPTGTKT